MTIDALWQQLAARGCRIRLIDAGRFRVTPTDGVDAELLAALHEHKPAILAVLEDPLLKAAQRHLGAEVVAVRPWVDPLPAATAPSRSPTGHELHAHAGRQVEWRGNLCGRCHPHPVPARPPATHLQAIKEATL